MKQSMVEVLKADMAGLWLDCLKELAPDLEDAVDEAGEHVPCPFHGGKDGFRLFDDAEDTGGGICNTCGSFPDGFALLMEANGWDFPKALREVHAWRSQQGDDCGDEQDSALPAVDPDAERHLAAIEQGARPDDGTIATYFKTRGLSGTVPESLLLHSELDFFDHSKRIGAFPTLLAPFIHPRGQTVAFQRIYLAPDGNGKAPVQEPKRYTKALWKGATSGAAIQLYPAQDTLIVAEGVETSIALNEATGHAVWAAGSATGMGNMVPPEKVRHIIIAADNDANGAGLAAAEKLAIRLLRDDPSRTVQIAVPDQEGHDWLDVLIASGPEAVQQGIADAFECSLTPDETDAETGNTEDESMLHQPLVRPLPPAEPFPVEALGDVLAAACEDLVRITQAPTALCAQSILAAVTLCVQPHADVEIDGRVRPCSNYFLTVAESGERKTAVDSEALAAVRDFELELRTAYKLEFAEYRHALEEYDLRRKETQRSNADERGEALRALGASPEEPRQPIILSEDPTIEGLGKSLVEGWPSMGIFSDEGGRFIGGYGMSKDNQLRTIAGLSKLYDGTPFNTVRSSSPLVSIHGKRLAVHLMVQPGVARKFLGDRSAIDQGIVNRMLIAQPESKIGERRYVRGARIATPGLDRYRQYLHEILRAPLPLQEGTNELSPRLLPLSERAMDAYVVFHDEIEHELRPDGRYATIRGFASKAAEHACRLAAILTLFENLHAHEIPAEDMADGILLAHFYLSEAVRQIGAGEVSEELELAQKLLFWMQQRGSRHTLVEIYQKGPTAIREAATARKAIEVLVAHGWVRKVKDDNGKQKGKKEVYELL